MAHSEKAMRIRTFQEGLDYKGLIVRLISLDEVMMDADLYNRLLNDFHLDWIFRAKCQLILKRTMLRWPNSHRPKTMAISESSKPFYAELPSSKNEKDKVNL